MKNQAQIGSLRPDDELNPKPPGPPERTLVTAILARGIIDYLSPDFYTELGDVWEWVHSDEVEAFTFVYCCHVLELSPKDLRQKLLELQPEDRHNFLYGQKNPSARSDWQGDTKHARYNAKANKERRRRNLARIRRVESS